MKTFSVYLVERIYNIANDGPFFLKLRAHHLIKKRFHTQKAMKVLSGERAHHIRASHYHEMAAKAAESAARQIEHGTAYPEYFAKRSRELSEKANQFSEGI